MKTRVLTMQANYLRTALLLAVLLSLTLVFQAYSQDSDKQLALNETSSALKDTKEVSFNKEAAESYLLSLNNTATENMGLSADMNRFETDNELNIELWMYCDYYWTGKLCESLLHPTVIEEEPLKVEKWMQDEHYWSGK